MRASRRRSALALLLLVLGACKSAGGRLDSPASPSADPAPSMGDKIVLQPGQSAVVAAGDLSLTFSGVTGDSRCPQGVACVWEGDAVVELQAARAAASARLELHTSDRFARHAASGPYRITLVQLDPVPVAGAPLPPGEYRAAFRVTRE